MFCQNCGNQISEGAKFCNNCGNRVGNSTQNNGYINPNQPVNNVQGNRNTYYNQPNNNVPSKGDNSIGVISALISTYIILWALFIHKSGLLSGILGLAFAGIGYVFYRKIENCTSTKKTFALVGIIAIAAMGLINLLSIML